MIFTQTFRSRLVAGPLLRLAALGLILGVVGGCAVPPGPSGNNNANDNTPSGNVSGEILTLKTNLPVSELDQPISVFYSIAGTPTRVDAFYRQVADATPGAGQIGNDIIAAAALQPGSSLAFTIAPADLGTGFYRIGLFITTSAGQFEVLSTGVLEVQGAPNPVFRQPAEPFSVVDKGDSVFVQWDNGDPEGSVQWRLFLLPESGSCPQPGEAGSDPLDELGTQLATGTGNVGSFTLSTANLLPGTYELGVSATDSGRSITTTVADGESYRIITLCNRFLEVTDPQSNRMPPTLVFTAPGANSVDLFRDEPFTIQFAGTVLEPGATGRIELFYDSDRTYTNGFHSIATDLPTSTQSFALPVAEMPEGTYNIGGTISDGVNELVIAYAAGAVRIVKTPTLTVTAPNTAVSIAPSTPGGVTNTVMVAWDTNVPADEGMVDVYALKVGAPATEIPVLAPSLPTVESALFSSTTAGQFEIWVRIRLDDGTVLQQKAPQDVRVSSLPTVLWVGELAKPTATFEGAIFQGVNFEDNAGSAFTTAGDLNDDGRDEFIIGARYGKPYFVNPSGIGHGEAYMIFGGTGTNKVVGEFNLNSVGTTVLPGVTIAGLRTVNTPATTLCEANEPSDETDGLSDLTMIPMPTATICRIWCSGSRSSIRAAGASISRIATSIRCLPAASTLAAAS